MLPQTMAVSLDNVTRKEYLATWRSTAGHLLALWLTRSGRIPPPKGTPYAITLPSARMAATACSLALTVITVDQLCDGAGFSFCDHPICLIAVHPIRRPQYLQWERRHREAFLCAGFLVAGCEVSGPMSSSTHQL